ncbi:MAG: LysR family transcriptional regulator [Sphingobacterium sp.]
MSYQIEIRHLLYFKTVAEELHFRKAAEKLFIAQPGLSRQIKQLEDFYKTELFIRDKRNVKLTKAGEYLKKEVELIFNNLTNIQEQIEIISQGKITSLKLGFIGSTIQTILPQLLVELKHKQPLVDISLNELSNEVQLSLLQKNELDFGFVRITDIPLGINFLPIYTDHFSLVVPKNYLKDSNVKIDISKLKNESFILFAKEYSNSYYDLVMSIFHDHGFQPNVTLKTVNALSIYNLVSEGLGVAIVPSSLQQGYQTDVEFIELDHLPQRTTLGMVWNNQNRNPGVPLLIKVIKELIKIYPTKVQS